MRKLRFYFLKYSSSVGFLAVFLSIPFWWFSVKDFSPYHLEILDSGIYGDDRVMYWDDFDGDGLTECMTVYQWSEGFYSLPISNADGTIKKQFNIKGELPRKFADDLIIDDYDGNRKKEIYLITNVNDTLFLNIIEPLGKGHIVNNFLIDYTKMGKAGIDYDISGTQLYDIGNDGFKELVISISGGFNISPRKIYIYDIKTGLLKKSKQLGSKNYDMKIADINQDGNAEFLISNFASGNMGDSINIPNDHNAYVYILNEDLNLINSSNVLKGYTQHVRMFPFRYQGKDAWANFHFKANQLEEKGYSLSLLNYNGNIIKQKSFKYNGVNSYLTPYLIDREGNQGVLFYRSPGGIFFLNEDLKLEKAIELQDNLTTPFKSLDLNGDGKEELLVFNKSGSVLYIFRDSFNKYEKIEVEIAPDRFIASIVKGKYEKPTVYFQVGQNWFNLLYERVSNYYLKLFVIVILIYLAVFIVVLFIQKVTANRERRKKKMAELQLTSWKNQLDPHFTFNTLNSVGAVILSEERYKAYDFFSKFSKLMRYALEASSKVSVSMEEELKFIDLYLQLEQFRFKNKFTYNLDVSEDVYTQKQVPKMLMQTYVENAVRHGLLDREEGGELLVKVYKADKNIVFQIEDNGVGRKKSSKKENLGNGVGMKVMKDYFKLLNSVNNRPIRIKILDQNESDSVYPGTIVYIVLPVGFSYEL